MLDWELLRSKLPTGSADERTDRSVLWQSMCEQARAADPSVGHSKQLTSQHLEAGLEKVLECEEHFNLRAAIQRASAVVREVSSDGPDGKLEPSEFRCLLVYLESLMHVLEAFPTIDASEECELSLAEVEAAWPTLLSAFPEISSDEDPVPEKLSAVWEELRGEAEAVELYNFADWAVRQGFAGAALLEDLDQDKSSASSAGAAAAEFRSAARVVMKHHPKLWEKNQPPHAVLECCKADEVDTELLAKILIQKNPDINMKDRVFNWTPLLFAANSGSLRVLTILLQKRAQINDHCKQGNSALHLAARRGHLQAVKYMLAKAKQMKLNAQNESGLTALAYCSVMGHSQVAELLVSAEADLSKTDAEGLTAGMWAARQGHLDVLNALLTGGFDVNVQDQEEKTVMDYAVENIEMRTALLATQALNCSLLDAVQRNCATEVKQALEAAAYVDAQDSSGWSPLSWAMLHHSMELVLLLAQRNANPHVCSESLQQMDLGADREALEESLVSGREAGVRLIAAAKANDWTTVDHELSLGANVNYREAVSLLTCVMCAAIHGDLDALLDLAGPGKNAKLDDCDVAGWTVLHFAVSSGNLEMVGQLHSMKANFFAKTYEGQQLLHLAARADDGAMIQLILAAKGRINAKDAENNTPLQFAVKWGSPDAVCTLLALDADPCQKTEDGKSLLAMATIQGHTSVIEVLLETELPPLTTILDKEFFEGKDKNDKRWQLFKQAHRKNQELTANGLPGVPTNFLLSEPDNLGQRPLSLSVIHRTEHALPLLLDKKAQVDAVDECGNTALMWAAAGGDRSVIETLLEGGAQAKLQNNDGKSAADCAKTTSLRRLLQKHTIENTVLKACQTPADEGLAVRWLYRVRLEGLPVLTLPDVLEEDLDELLRKKKDMPSPYRVELVTDNFINRPLGYAYLDYLEEYEADVVALQKGWKLGWKQLRLVKEGARSETYKPPVEALPDPVEVDDSSGSDDGMMKFSFGT